MKNLSFLFVALVFPLTTAQALIATLESQGGRFNNKADKLQMLVTDTDGNISTAAKTVVVQAALLDTDNDGTPFVDGPDLPLVAGQAVLIASSELEPIYCRQPGIGKQPELP